MSRTDTTPGKESKPRKRPTARPAITQRRIDNSQFAFLRAVILGVPISDAAHRYLLPGLALRDAQEELRWMRAELMAAARRAGAFGDARVLQLDMAQLPMSVRDRRKDPGPTLDEFRERVDPDGFFSEAELLEQYREQYPSPASDQRAQRIARLRERQRRSLETLQAVLVQPPKLSDPPSAWFEPKVARRLEAVGYDTLQKLAEWIRTRGNRWWVLVPKVGEVAARRIVDWFARNAEALGVKLDSSVRFGRNELTAAWRDRRVAIQGIVPMERLSVPSELDGSCGTSRLPGVSQLRAQNDRQAIEAWIAARAGGNSNTERAYRREAERLLLWAVFERRVAMSSLTVDDAIAFSAFLRNPLPADRWVSHRASIRLSPAWRPFKGPLSERSAAFALTVLGSMFDWLTRQHYLTHNIFGALPRANPISAAAQADPDRLMGQGNRYLSTAQWSVMRAALPGLGSDEAGLRERLAVLLAYTTGLRLAELTDARVGRLQSTIDELETGDGRVERRVTLRVLGKRNKLRVVPIVPKIEELIDEYLESRGLPGWVECQRQGLNGVRLIGHLSGATSPETALSEKMVYLIVKGAFQHAGSVLRRKGLDQDAAILEKASTHWLRHTFGRHALAGDVKVNVVQAILGHASLSTTTLYTSDDGVEAYDAVRRFTKHKLQ